MYMYSTCHVDKHDAIQSISQFICICIEQVPSGMLSQVRFLYESELKKLNKRNVKQALQKMSQSETTTPTKKPEVAHIKI